MTSLREQLSEVLEAEEDWTKAAHVLAGINLDSSVRNTDSAYRLAKYVKIAMLYLEVTLPREPGEFCLPSPSPLRAHAVTAATPHTGAIGLKA